MSGVDLEAHLVAAHGEFTLDAGLRVRAGGVTAVLGPNGAGKSTMLHCLAGLTPLTGGSMRLGGRLLEDPAAGVRLRAADRRIGMVFQDGLLFPHLSTRDNVAFGPRHAGLRRSAARARADEWLERVDLVHLADRRPAQLSGGQRQRVAITRALATEPDLLLLDEPLSALDAAAAIAVRTFLRRHLAGVRGGAVLVTHDAIDALVLADEVLVVEAGRVVQGGPPAEVARMPRSRHVAAVLGLNLLRGQTEPGAVRLPGGAALTVTGEHTGPGFACFSPGAVALHAERPRTSARNVWELEVDGLAPHGDVVRVHLTGPVQLLADITPAALADLGISDGDRVWASVKATEITVYGA